MSLRILGRQTTKLTYENSVYTEEALIPMSSLGLSSTTCSSAWFLPRNCTSASVSFPWTTARMVCWSAPRTVKLTRAISWLEPTAHTRACVKTFMSTSRKTTSCQHPMKKSFPSVTWVWSVRPCPWTLKSIPSSRSKIVHISVWFSTMDIR